MLAGCSPSRGAEATLVGDEPERTLRFVVMTASPAPPGPEKSERPRGRTELTDGKARAMTPVPWHTVALVRGLCAG